MAGRWQGEAFGSSITEIWTPPEQGTNMTGVFRMMRGGKVGLYELMAVDQTAKGPVLRMKHFNALLHSREEKAASLEFALVKLDGRTATWETKEGEATVTLVYRSTNPGELEVDFQKTGPQAQQATFRFKRVTAVP